MLDDGGVLYDPRSQELHALNPVATFLWMVLEKGASPAELARAFSDRFVRDASRARAWVGDLLADWSGRGWLGGGAAAEAGAVREGEARLPRPAEAAPRRDRARAAKGVRRYRLLTTRFDLGAPPALDARVSPVLAHLECDDADPPDVLLELRDGVDGIELLEDGRGVERVEASDALAPLVKLHLRRLATDRHRYFAQIHAGAVLCARGVVLLPAPPGSGKTTLTAGLAAAGFGYLSDEVVLLEPETLAVRPVPLALTVKPGAVGPLGERYPEVAGLAVHRREDDQRVRYLTPPAASRLDDREGGYPVCALVFPRFAEGAAAALRPVGRSEALGRLLAECLTLPDWLSAERVGNLVQWLRGLECWELEMGGLPEAVALVGERFETP